MTQASGVFLPLWAPFGVWGAVLGARGVAVCPRQPRSHPCGWAVLWDRRRKQDRGCAAPQPFLLRTSLGQGQSFPTRT